MKTKRTLVANWRRLPPAVALALALPWRAAAADSYVFTSFRGNGEDGLHLALSTDGYHWQALNGDRPLLKPEIGGHKLMRDPCAVQGPDGTFHMVWTTGGTTDKRWSVAGVLHEAARPGIIGNGRQWVYTLGKTTQATVLDNLVLAVKAAAVKPETLGIPEVEIPPLRQEEGKE